MNHGVVYLDCRGHRREVEFDNTELWELLTAGADLFDARALQYKRNAKARDFKGGGESIPTMQKLARQIIQNGAWPDEY